MLRDILLVTLVWAASTNGFSLPTSDSYERSELVRVKDVSERSGNGDRRLHIRAFGEDHHVTLQQANDIFSPEFRMYRAETREDGKPVFHSTTDAESPSHDRLDGHFYSVDGSTSAGSVFVKEKDGLKVEGLINDRLLIVPHSIPQEDREGNLYDHTVYQLRNFADNYVNDTWYPPSDSTPTPITTRQSQVPGTVSVDVLVLFDYVNTKALNFDQNKIKEYVGVFWNFVQNRYSPAKDPNIKLSISGLLTFNSDNDQPFIKGKKIDDSRVYDSFLGDMRSWLEKGSGGLPKNDVVMLQTGLNAGTVSGGKFQDTAAGIAYVGTACSNKNGYNSGFSEDKAPMFSGMLTAAHELGHILSLDHDGEGNGGSCSNGDGYIMATHGGGKRQYQFSPCSVSSLKTFVRRSDKKCLWDTPTSQVSLSTKTPASLTPSLDDQCKQLYDESYFFLLPITEDICKWVYCTTKSMNGGWTSKGGAPEGTPCGIGKMCTEGECKPNGVASLDQQCKYFGQEYNAWGKEDANICSRLWCTKDNQHLTSIGGATDGSVCGSYGSCLSQKCIGQIVSMDDQCKRDFGNEYYAYNKDKSSEVCSRLWCTKDSRSLTSRGAADPLSSCASGKVCRDKNCVNP